MKLLQAATEIGKVAKTKSTRERIEARVGIRQIERIALLERNFEGLRFGLLSSNRQHRRHEIATNHVCFRAEAFDRQCKITRAGRHVQHIVRRIRQHFSSGRRAPTTVHAQRQHAVQQVIPARDAVKHRLDLFGLVWIFAHWWWSIAHRWMLSRSTLTTFITRIRCIQRKITAFLNCTFLL